MSQNDLAKRIGKTRSMISQYESDTCAPRMGTVEDLARAFGVKKREIVDEHVDYAHIHISELTADERDLLDLFRNMDNRARRDLLGIARSLSAARGGHSEREEGVA